MAECAVELKNLSRSYGRLQAVANLTFSVSSGQMFALVGPDGAGKTTTIRLLCGLISPSSGTASVAGYDLNRDPDKIKERIGYLSQEFSLYEDLNVDENIEFFAEIHGIRDYRSRREELLEFTRLKPFRRRLADRLSGGMKQKLALACTLIHRPQIVFLDEPTTGVDPVSRRDFWIILSSLLKRGITVFMTTPYMDEAERCNRVGLLSRGILLAVDTPQGIKSRLEGCLLEVASDRNRKAYNLLQKAGLPGLLEVQLFGDRLHVRIEDRKRDLDALHDTLQREGIRIRESRLISPGLEDVFISLVRKERSSA